MRGRPAEIPMEITQALERITGQLDLMNKTLQVFEMRIGNNEEQISQILRIVSDEMRQGPNIPVGVPQGGFIPGGFMPQPGAGY